MPDQPRPEYPRPQFRRADWLCLNGTGSSRSTPATRGWSGAVQRELAGGITVPFCPESTLSGVGHVDFMAAVWYRCTVDLPAAWPGGGCCCTSGRSTTTRRCGSTGPRSAGTGAGSRRSRSTSRTWPCRASVEHGRPRPGRPAAARPAGAAGQAGVRYDNTDCHYTRTTGIWQTVWVEPVGRRTSSGRGSRRTWPAGRSRSQFPLGGSPRGYSIRAALSDGRARSLPGDRRGRHGFAPAVALAMPATGGGCGRSTTRSCTTCGSRCSTRTARVVDALDSYAGLRGVTIEGKAILLNGTPVFQRLVLDQGFYPDGILTAPTDQALIDDIKLSQAAGFNGARLHQKVFEERFLHHCDRLGYSSGASSRTGAATGTARPATTSSRPRRTSASGSRPSSGTTATRPSSAGAR